MWQGPSAKNGEQTTATGSRSTGNKMAYDASAVCRSAIFISSSLSVHVEDVLFTPTAICCCEIELPDLMISRTIDRAREPSRWACELCERILREHCPDKNQLVDLSHPADRSHVHCTRLSKMKPHVIFYFVLCPPCQSQRHEIGHTLYFKNI